MRWRTFTTCAACLNGFVKPRLGMRRMSGICPPSNPGRTLPPWRAVWPLPPRPAVLPIPEPGPRPLRMRARCEPTGGFRSWSASRVTRDSGLGVWDFVLARGFRVAFAFGFGILLLSFFFRRHLDEVPHLLEHAAQRGMIRVYHFRLVMLEAQRLERPLHAIRVAAARSHLLDAQLPFPHRRQDRIPPRFALAVFPRRGQPTHARPRFPGGHGNGWPRAPRRVRARRGARSSAVSGRRSWRAPCCADWS